MTRLSDSSNWGHQIFVQGLGLPSIPFGWFFRGWHSGWPRELMEPILISLGLPRFWNVLTQIFWVLINDHGVICFSRPQTRRFFFFYFIIQVIQVPLCPCLTVWSKKRVAIRWVGPKSWWESTRFKATLSFKASGKMGQSDYLRKLELNFSKHDNMAMLAKQWWVIPNFTIDRSYSYHMLPFPNGWFMALL